MSKKEVEEDADLLMTMSANFKMHLYNLFLCYFLNLFQDITVLVEDPDDANTVEATISGVQIVKLSEDDFTGILADGQKAAFSFAFIFFIALLF